VKPLYIPLVNASWHSILDSTMAPQVVVEAAVACGMQAVGLTDGESLSGMLAFYKAARAKGVHAVVGALVRITGFRAAPVRCALLVQNAVGYCNLCQLLTRGVTRENAGALADGLICLYMPGNAASRRCWRACANFRAQPGAGLVGADGRGEAVGEVVRGCGTANARAAGDGSRIALSDAGGPRAV
jgi:hypothetical protein